MVDGNPRSVEKTSGQNIQGDATDRGGRAAWKRSTSNRGLSTIIHLTNASGALDAQTAALQRLQRSSWRMRTCKQRAFM
jgi:hypothetical protein